MRALAATLMSLVVWSAWTLIHPTWHPWQDLSRGSYSDHFSHVAAVRLLPLMRKHLWTQPITANYRRLTLDEENALPKDAQSFKDGGNFVLAFRVPGWDKPLIINWAGQPRPYPPGDLVLFSPLSLLQRTSSLSFSTLNRLTIFWLVLLAHVAVFILFDGLSRSPRLWFVTLLIYFELIHWSLEGFYDATAVAPLLLCARYLDERRPLALLTAFSVATFLHFRALLFVPWVLWAAWLGVRERVWRNWARRELAAATVAIVLGTATILTFALTYHWLKGFDWQNPVKLTWSNWPRASSFLFVMVAVAIFQLRAGAWLEAAMVLWTGLFAADLKQTFPWHPLLLLPWLTVPAASAPVEGVRLFWVLFVAAFVFHSVPLPTWLPSLL
jgi:hypothetical protein